MKETRPYTMRARAAAVEETRRRILDATFELAADRLISAISLDAVARGAGVSVQTVLRQFGNREALIDATAQHAADVVAAEREATPGDLPGAMRVLLDHYERRGDASVMLLAQESDPVVTTVVTRGRGLHRTWVATVFEPLLVELEEPARERATDLLAVATDVYTWKLLRRDRRLSRGDVEDRMLRLVEAVLERETRQT